MVYQANPDFYLGAPSIPQIVVKLYTGVGIRLYETGDIDVTGVSAYDAQTVLDPANPMHPDLLSGVSLCTSYVTFDVSKPPFDDVKVRQAFSMAFDKQKYIDVVNNGVGILAKGAYPPALPGLTTRSRRANSWPGPNMAAPRGCLPSSLPPRGLAPIPAQMWPPWPTCGSRTWA